MKKILVLSFVALMFVACNLAKDSVKLAPDIEITWIDPLGYYLPVDSVAASITQVDFVPMNSIDAYLKGVVFTYTDAYNNTIYGPTEMFPLYASIKGIVRPDSIDKVSIVNVYIPRTDSIYTYLVNTNLHSANAKVDFVFTDQYEMNTLDTASAWFGFYLE